MSPNVQPASAALAKDEAEAIIRPKAFDTGPLLVSLNALQSLRFATTKRSMVEVTTSRKKGDVLEDIVSWLYQQVAKIVTPKRSPSDFKASKDTRMNRGSIFDLSQVYYPCRLPGDCCSCCWISSQTDSNGSIRVRQWCGCCIIPESASGMNHWTQRLAGA